MVRSIRNIPGWFFAVCFAALYWFIIVCLAVSLSFAFCDKARSDHFHIYSTPYGSSWSYHSKNFSYYSDPPRSRYNYYRSYPRYDSRYRSSRYRHDYGYPSRYCPHSGRYRTDW